MAQMNLLFPEVKVDEKATRARVKREFKDYHDKKATLETLNNISPTHFLRGIKQPTMSTTSTAPICDADLIRSGHVSNTGQDLTMLTERMEKHQERVDGLKSYCEMIERAVDGLPAVEGEIMRRTLLVDPAVRKTDRFIWPELGLGKSDYYERKEKAMLRIAFALQIEVYEKDVAA